ncbi:hypothetical protein AB0929_20945 [Streptomyces massasporeus]|uniref:hypothetical protein n=1 Tax=Streptomyces massasporeus TaxID=67324 RepID=UPI0034548CBC
MRRGPGSEHRRGRHRGAARRARRRSPGRAGPVLRRVRVRRGLAPQRRPATAPWNLAREFFARHSPQERHRVAVCHSWLLDPVADGSRCGAASSAMFLNSPPVPSRSLGRVKKGVAGTGVRMRSVGRAWR